MTPDALAALRGRLPDCELALYADLGSRTVLCADGNARYPQEHLDALCQSAAEVFAAASGTPEPEPGHVLFFSPTGLRAYFRSLSEPGEALCCVCAPDADVTALVETVRAALSRERAGA